jgi:hypothetical protein
MRRFTRTHYPDAESTVFCSNLLLRGEAANSNIAVFGLTILVEQDLLTFPEHLGLTILELDRIHAM